MDKLQYNVHTIDYMGRTITSDGAKPDGDRVQAIVKMPPPENKKALQRFLGMIRYLSQYIQNEATLTAPLRYLLKDEADWQWSPKNDKALERLKIALTQAPVLKYYGKQLVIQTDASMDRLGAVLMQEGHPLFTGTHKHGEKLCAN